MRDAAVGVVVDIFSRIEKSGTVQCFVCYTLFSLILKLLRREIAVNPASNEGAFRFLT